MENRSDLVVRIDQTEHGHQVQVSLLTRVLDFFRAEDEVRVEWTSPEYERVDVLWGLLRWEKGERRTIVIRGKPGFCAAVLADLQRQGQLRRLP
ncbi:MAG: hypothetical protein OZSIB_1023 [Candidatus Ozemobacter sibiricus]|jgi:hypothetical protein|uniref:Uncharacterized protein n=1 Tax=Candidatus Ozemobacter sibiricus TaxID=2268124 RepID=A0A367ZLB1_9BACT|nr:MAG: hypothetical protein OZSIB_1023 [Candidatus Ozemobacter sibiricus]